MKRLLPLLLLIPWALAPAPSLWAQSFQAGQLNSNVVRLAWSGISGQVTLERRLPGQPGFVYMATTTDNLYMDTIPYHYCGDTIRYRLVFPPREHEVRVYFRDALPTTMPELRVCTVDSASQRLQLHWLRVPDPDIMGYTICKRDDETAPWMEVGTVTSPDRTSAELSLSPLTLHQFRIYAFDSCLTASAMTEPVGNMVLELTHDPLSGDVQASWSDYPSHLLEGEEGYDVELVAFADEQGQPTTTYQHVTRNRLSFRVPDGTVLARVTALAAGRQSRSNTVEARFTPPPPPPPPDLPSPPDPPDPPEPPAPDVERETVWIPNAFTPEESTNNRFCLHTTGLRDYQLSLFDRLGQQVFHTDDPSACWDGRLPGGQKAPLGAYLYLLAYLNPHGSPQVIKGTVLLIR